MQDILYAAGDKKHHKVHCLSTGSDYIQRYLLFSCKRLQPLAGEEKHMNSHKAHPTHNDGFAQEDHTKHTTEFDLSEIPQEMLDAQNAETFYASPAAEVPENLSNLCQLHICPTCPVQAEAEDARLRAAAEMENFKRRLQRDYTEQANYVGEKILTDLLPSLDSLDLAIQYAGTDPACASLLQGVVMTRKLLLDGLKIHGLVPVGEVGEAFDHEIHEAVSEELHPDKEENTVVGLLQRGYRLKARLLRPAKVVISRKA